MSHPSSLRWAGKGKRSLATRRIIHDAPHKTSLAHVALLRFDHRAAFYLESLTIVMTTASSTNPTRESLPETALLLAEVGRDFYRRGWVLGTSGNFSAVVNQTPLRLLITASGMHKGQLTAEQFVQVDEQAAMIAGYGRPSDEARLHLALVRERGAQAVLHTHSVWSTILSDAFAADGGIKITGYEMLKGLAGVRSHEHEEWLPIIENSQDMSVLGARLEDVLRSHPNAHGFLLRGHGLYTWGQSIAEAQRHVEILEFLLEVTGRTFTVSVPRP
jgi:methylthioribulose-1-phosphate dehydratase